MDGLLLDTESLYTVAQQQIVGGFGKTFTWELKAKMMGQKALAAAQILVDDLQLHEQITPEAFLKEREEVLDVLFATCSLMPGVDRLIRHLHKHGVPIAVATSSHQRHFDLKTSSHKELFSLFTHIITGDQVVKGKPDPEIFLKAAATFAGPGGSPAAPAPSQCLVFEDAPSGLQAAIAAGMPCVMVPDPNLDRALCQGADEIIGSIADWDPSKWGLPAFDA